MTINTSATLNCAQAWSQAVVDKSDLAAGTNVEFSVQMEISETAGAAAQAQTLEDVKREFYSYLDSLAISPGLSGTSIRVNITDAAFQKMLADPEYKQKMKDLCARDLCDPAWTKMAGMGLAPSASVITIDADCEEEYLATSYNSPSARGKADGDGFWSRRTKNNQAARKAQEKRNQEKREMQEFLEELAAEKKYLPKMLFSAYFANFGIASALRSYSGSGESAGLGTEVIE